MRDLIAGEVLNILRSDETDVRVAGCTKTSVANWAYLKIGASAIVAFSHVSCTKEGLAGFGSMQEQTHNFRRSATGSPSVFEELSRHQAFSPRAYLCAI
ncbi:hypothetical protein ALC56_08997 [Trachymyrmex septentrionalis]|uniref:Uncharacterized protein n=1 Tax=Trachymyrmex septentrionalis TaxID=34720 RepID=A0A195FA02_9HYME|nr:hypothetical protein ALC56_08997 [Trachymyrmex septentrionalis]